MQNYLRHHLLITSKKTLNWGVYFICMYCSAGCLRNEIVIIVYRFQHNSVILWTWGTFLILSKLPNNLTTVLSLDYQEFAVNYWISSGAPANKLTLGMPLYGRGFTLDNASVNGLYAPASNPLPAGPYSREPGFWGYNEVRCLLIDIRPCSTKLTASLPQCHRSAPSKTWEVGTLFTTSTTRPPTWSRATCGSASTTPFLWPIR